MTCIGCRVNSDSTDRQRETRRRASSCSTPVSVSDRDETTTDDRAVSPQRFGRCPGNQNNMLHLNQAGSKCTAYSATGSAVFPIVAETSSGPAFDRSRQQQRTTTTQPRNHTPESSSLEYEEKSLSGCFAPNCCWQTPPALITFRAELTRLAGRPQKRIACGNFFLPLSHCQQRLTCCNSRAAESLHGCQNCSPAVPEL